MGFMPMNRLRSTFARAAELVSDTERPWRRSFIAVRASHVYRDFGPLGGFARQLRKRFEARFDTYPRAVPPYLMWVRQAEGPAEALSIADRLATSPRSTAGTLVEVAHYLYSVRRYASGDRVLERAKTIEPSLFRIYEEEAWNQRFRGNLHREIQAVEHCVSLAEDESERFEWSIWLGQALVRQQQFEEAWEHLRHFERLQSGDTRALTAAYCARMLGHHERSELAYAVAAPSDSDGFDRLEAARNQLKIYLRADEATRLLGPLDESSSTASLELAYSASIRLGQDDTALRMLVLAATRPDRSKWVVPTLAQLHELEDRRGEALKWYLEATPMEETSLVAFRTAVLLYESGDMQGAVERALSAPPTDTELDHLRPGVEVDPGWDNSPGEGSSTDSSMSRKRRSLAAASEFSLLRQRGRELAELCSARGDWDGAWTAVLAMQLERLPSIPLGVEPAKPQTYSLNAFYSECCETEPIVSGKILYESSLGGSTSCNPLALCLEMLDDPEYRDCLHVWSILPGTTVHRELLGRENVVFVRKGSHGHLRHLATAETIINNSTLETAFNKRPGQRLIATWHGVPWKTLGKDSKSEPFAYGNIARTMLHADLVLCPDPHTRDVLSRGMDIDLLIDAPFRVGGYPRNDLALKLPEDVRSQIRAEIGVGDTERLVLYMPTWKGLFHQRNAEVKQVLETSRAMHKTGHIVALRAHHYVSDSFRGAGAPDGVALIPDHWDTNELIGAADVVVTDFSSVLFDAAAVGVPVVKLVGDIENYDRDRGLYFPASDVPGANAQDAAEARSLIGEALEDPARFISMYQTQTERFSAVENGTSARTVLHALAALDDEPSHGRVKTKTVLLSTGGLPPNGITRALRSLLHSLKPTEYIPYLFPTANTIDGADQETRTELRENARLLPFVGTSAGTRMELEVLRFFSSRWYVQSPLIEGALARNRRRESRRQFGQAQFFSAVEYSAYDAVNAASIAFGAPVQGGRRGIIFHNEMLKEIENRFPRLQSEMRILDAFDFLGSVSDGVRDYNAKTLHERFGVDPSQHITTENMINVDEIRERSREPLSDADLAWYETPGAHACVVARMSPEKNHAELLRALAAVSDKLPRTVKLTFLGDGPLRLELEELIGSLGLQSLVRMRGLVDNPHAHVKRADTMILPSLHEGQPLVILEALTVGTPVVATDTPGSRSVLRNGELGALVPVSREGLQDALKLIATGTTTGLAQFDADDFTRDSRAMFIKAIDPIDA